MKERIKELRKCLGLTQQKFADNLGLKRQTVASYEIGNIEPSDSTKLLICKQYNVRSEWLEFGIGEMFESISKEEQVGSILGNVFTDTESKLYDFKMSVFSELGKLSDSDWEVIQKIVDNIKKE